MRHTSRFLGATVFLIALVACAQPDVPTGANLPTPVPAAATAFPAADPTRIAWAVQHQEDMFIFVHSLKERVTTSRVIFLANVQGTGEVINTSRNVEDITKPATDSFGVGQVYHLQVKCYLKGTGPDSINMINGEGFLPNVDPASVKPEHIAQLKATSGYAPLHIGTTYLFFLDPFTGLDFPGTYYIGSNGYPWRFAVKWDNTLEADGPHSPMRDVVPEFAPRPLTELLPQVDQLVQAEKAAAPTK